MSLDILLEEYGIGIQKKTEGFDESESIVAQDGESVLSGGGEKIFHISDINENIALPGFW